MGGSILRSFVLGIILERLFCVKALMRSGQGYPKTQFWFICVRRLWTFFTAFKTYSGAKEGHTHVRLRIQKYIRIGSPTMMPIVTENAC